MAVSTVRAAAVGVSVTIIVTMTVALTALTAIFTVLIDVATTTTTTTAAAAAAAATTTAAAAPALHLLIQLSFMVFVIQFFVQAAGVRRGR